ncbi:MAG: TolC family protein, partial [Thermoanaerobaculia bacterium]|nr:TolC family protein [Thermoanaerobaculia bacterium]
MTARRHTALLILAALLAAPALAAQRGPTGEGEVAFEVTLVEALASMEVNSLELRVAGAETTSAAGLAEQARAYPNPRLSLTHESLDGRGESYHESYLFFDQPIEWPALRRARADSADRRTDAAEESREVERVRLAHEVSVAYLEAVGAEERRTVLEDLRARYLRAEEAAVAQVREGELSGYRLRRIRVERMRVEILLAEAEIDIGRARRRLGLLILPAGDPRVPVPTDEFLGRPP